MSTTTTLEQPIELELSTPQSSTPLHIDVPPNTRSSRVPFEPYSALETDAYITDAIPDGGYGWIIVASGFLVTFWVNSVISCWGVMQKALLDSNLSYVSTSTASFVGSLNLCLGVAFGLFWTRLASVWGARVVAMLGVMLMGTGLMTAGSSTRNVAGLFVTVGMVAGVGQAAVYAMGNALPVQYFSGRLGLANGLVKMGGGVGGTVMAIVLEALVRKVGVEWTFRIQGAMTLATGLPAAWFMRDRVPIRKAPFVELSMFRSKAFLAIFAAGAVGTFALFVPPYYLPLFAQSLGLSSSTGAGLVAAFNATNAIGRFSGGPLSDKIGPTNTLVLTMVLNAVSMLAIWPVSSTLAPLVIFSILNGVANGAFFTVFPTVVAGIFGPGRASTAMSTSITGWSPGYLLGAPLAGFLLQAAGGQRESERMNIGVYRPAIFYAGGLALVSSMFALLARVNMARGLIRRV